MNYQTGRKIIFIALSTLFAACNAPVLPEPAAGCHPLGDGDCMGPFPSSFFEVAATDSPTGYRVALTPAAMPLDRDKIPLRAERVNRRDGFSPATPFIVRLPANVDAKGLPTATAPESSMTAAGPVQLLDYTDGARVPLFAELDAGGDGEPEQALLIRPLVRLKPGHRYVAALREIRDQTGAPVIFSAFNALRDQKALNRAQAALKNSYEEIFSLLERNGVARTGLTLAWDVMIGSDEATRGNLPKLVAQARQLSAEMGYQITTTMEPDEELLYRQVRGTFTVPSFLTQDELEFARDSAGQVVTERNMQVPFIANIPACAKTAKAPLPVLLIGHGLFSGAIEQLTDDTGIELGEYLCMVEVAIDWMGVAGSDLPVLTNQVITDLNRFNILTDRLQQAHVNFQLFTGRLRDKILHDQAFAIGKTAVADGNTIFYLGISNGGIQGATFLALSPDVDRGVLHVPGANWNLMVSRSSAFSIILPVLRLFYPNAVALQRVLALSQSDWDTSDPVEFASRLIREPLAGHSAKKILVQEAVGDSTVSNLATRLLVREIGLPGIVLSQPVYGVSTAAAPAESAYTQWDIMPMPLPAGRNVPPMENGAHASINSIPLLREQILRFLKTDGKVDDVCTGPCIF